VYTLFSSRKYEGKIILKEKGEDELCLEK
jgi:hypothetical protein